MQHLVANTRSTKRSTRLTLQTWCPLRNANFGRASPRRTFLPLDAHSSPGCLVRPYNSRYRRGFGIHAKVGVHWVFVAPSRFLYLRTSVCRVPVWFRISGWIFGVNLIGVCSVSTRQSETESYRDTQNSERYIHQVPFSRQKPCILRTRTQKCTDSPGTVNHQAKLHKPRVMVALNPNVGFPIYNDKQFCTLYCKSVWSACAWVFIWFYVVYWTGDLPYNLHTLSCS